MLVFEKYNFTLNRILHIYFKNIYAVLLFEYLIKKIGQEMYIKLSVEEIKNDLLFTDWEFRSGIKIIANFVKNITDIEIGLNLFENKAFYYLNNKKTKQTIFFYNQENHKKILLDAQKKASEIDVSVVEKQNLNDNEIFLAQKDRLLKFEITDFICKNEKLKNAFVDFLISRTKKTITQTIISDYCYELQALTQANIETAIKICKRSAKYNWNDLYPLEKQKFSTGSNGAMKTKKWQGIKDLEKNKESEVAKRLSEQYKKDLELLKGN